MADPKGMARRPGSWRGRLTVLGLFGLGLLALTVLRIAYLRVPPPPPELPEPPPGSPLVGP